jgi:hypothetical protein
METMPLEVRSPVAAEAERHKGMATERAADAGFVALQSAVNGAPGVAQQRALHRIADQSPAVHHLARLQRTIGGGLAAGMQRRDTGRSSAISANREGPAAVAATTMVVQRTLTLSSRDWSEAKAVTILRTGVYRVKGALGESLVIKTSADTDSTLDEYVGAKLGQFLGVNTVETKAVRIGSDEVQQAIPHFEKLGEGGAALADAIQSSPHQFMLVMPYIDQPDLKASKEIQKPDMEQQQAWAQEMGKIWLLDLLLQNTDRNPGNFMFDQSGRLYAIDQALFSDFIRDFGKEKVESVLADVARASDLAYEKLTGLGVPVEEKIFHNGFIKGAYAAREKLEPITPETITTIYDTMEERESALELPGLAEAIAAIKTGL